MNQNSPSLTVVIPNFNHGHLIGDLLGSVFSQSIQPTKIIIIDDASTDDSVSTIQQLISSRQDIEFLRKETNSGPVALINEALHLVTSDYVTFLAADDMTLPGFFETTLALLVRYPKAALCSGICRVQYRSEVRFWPDWTEYPCSTPAFVPPERVRELFFRIENWIMCNTVIYRREPLVAAGGFDPALHSYTDGFLCRVLALRHGACFIPEPLTIFRLSDSGYSKSDSRDEDKAEKILIYSNACMATKFSRLFPAELVARNKSRMLFRLLSARLDNFQARTRNLVEATQLTYGSSLLLFIVRWATGILKLLFFCVLRFRDIPRAALSRLWRKTPLPH